MYEALGTDLPVQTEVNVYGSSRLGIMRPNAEPTPSTSLGGAYGTAKLTTFTRGEKFFELSNHLGNVLVTISDKRLAISSNGTSLAYYAPDVMTATDYAPFGMPLVGRNVNSDTYRYGFNGKENDNEVKGEGNQIDFGARGYDARRGQWLSVDPKAAKLPFASPYSFCLNNPLIFLDPDGQFPILVNGRVSKNSEKASWTYWDKSVRETIKLRTGYYHSQFKYVDGDKGFWPSTRVEVGMAQGKTDAAAVYSRLKESMKDGQITEQLQVFSHSKGGAFVNGYMNWGF